MKKSFGVGASLAAILFGVTMTSPVLAEVLNFEIPQPVIISDTGISDVWVSSQAAPPIGWVKSIAVTLSHEWLGDLIVLKVIPPSGGAEFLLFSRIGVPPDYSSAVLGNLEFGGVGEGAASLVPVRYTFTALGADFATEAAMAEGQPLPVIPAGKTYAAESWPSGPFAPGIWQLEIFDNANLSGGTLAGLEVSYTRRPDGDRVGRSGRDRLWHSVGACTAQCDGLGGWPSCGG